jgi:mannosyltransferase OCH1-like enzyme
MSRGDDRLWEPIPRLLHQTWKTTAIPEEWAAYRDSWLRHHASWRHRLWTDDDLDRLVAERYPWFLPTYRAFPRKIQRVDAGKYLILHACGGVYADLDCECLRPLDPIVERGGLIVVRTPDRVIDGAMLASPPGHPFWLETFAQMTKPPRWVGLLAGVPPLRASHVLLTTGPQMLRRAVRRYRGAIAAGRVSAGVTIIERDDIASRSWLRRFEPASATDGWVRHHHADSWLTPLEARLHGYLTARNAIGAAFVLAMAMAAVLVGLAR